MVYVIAFWNLNSIANFPVCKILSIFVNISDKPRVYNGRAYFLNIFYAPNITKLGFFLFRTNIVVIIGIIIPIDVGSRK